MRPETPSCGGFAFAHYRETLAKALKLGYQFATFSGHAKLKSKRRFLMRHDVDLSLENCLVFAEIEKSLGIRATYFIRVHARLYNPFEFHAYARLRTLEKLGHEIGLHYEPGFALAAGEDPKRMVRREKAILEAVLGHPVASASAHLPGKNGATVEAGNLKSFGFKNEAYLPRFTMDYKYLSDSNGRWREGCFCGHLGVQDRLCVTTHGWWWFRKSPVENY